MSRRGDVRILALLAALLLVLTACGDGGGGEQASPDDTGGVASPTDDETGGEASGEPIRIGMLTSLTGPFTAWGVQVQAAMNMAADEINAEGGINGRPIEIVEADDQNNPETAVSELERMVEQDGVVAVGGVISSDVGLATARTAEEMGVPLFMVKAGAAEILTPESRFTFRTCLPAAPMVAQPVAQYVEDEGFERVGAIIADYAWGQSVRASLEDQIGSLEGVEQQIEVAPIGEQDFTTYLRRLQEFDPAVIVGTGHPPGNGPMVVQSADLGMNVPIAGAWTPFTLVMGGVGEAGYDRYADFSCADYSSDSYIDLAQRFIENTDETFLEDDGVAGYGIVQMVAEAATEAGDDPEAIAQYLHDNSFDLPGYSHTMEWTEWGELAQSQPTFIIIEQTDPPAEGVIEGADWYPVVQFTADPLEPYDPGA